MKRYLWIGLGLVLVGLFVYSWFRALDNPYRKVIGLSDGSTVRVIGISVGKQPELHPRGEPLSGLLGRQRRSLRLWETFPEPVIVVWLAQDAGRPVANPVLGLRATMDVCVVDSKGACLPAGVQFVGFDGVGEMNWAVILPYLPPTERTVELRFRDPESKRTVRLTLPRLQRPDPPALKPQPLPARVENDNFTFILKRLSVQELRIGAAGRQPNGVIHRVVVPEVQIIPKRAGEQWRIDFFWLEDPYGNKYYNASAPPPWHYPYWILHCQVSHGFRQQEVRIPTAPLSEAEVRQLWENASNARTIQLAPLPPPRRP
ncbi:MAG: hypothetical protein NZ556_03490 [Fimbriimonadales bacterium]|nr:hypothetical protein [Fimbriimonadales bacterium]